MQSLFIPATEDEFITPSVSFDISSGLFEMIGESYIEDTESFYSPLWDWLKEFVDTSTQDIVFNFKFSYYNSSSSKAILRIIKILKEHSQKAKVSINWFYPNNDLEQEGLDFADMVEIPITMIKSTF